MKFRRTKGKHADGAAPVPAQEAFQEDLWDKYVKTRETLGIDDTRTWDVLFEWIRAN